MIRSWAGGGKGGAEGDLVGWSPAPSAIMPGGSFTYTPDPDFFGSDAFTYHAHDSTNNSNIATVSITIQPEGFVVAEGESTTTGTIVGDFRDTYGSDDVYEALTEEVQGQSSKLDHQWVFNMDGREAVRFDVEAYHDGVEDDFQFEFSADAASWQPMLTVTRTSDDNEVQSYFLPTGLTATVYVRVVDTVHKKNATTLDTLYVDRMIIE